MADDLISIPGFPTTDPEPGVHVFGETNQGDASSGTAPLRVLLVSEKVCMPSAQGTETTTAAKRISSVDDAGKKYGYGSGIHQMYDGIVAGCPTIEAFGAFVAAGAGTPVQATKALVFSGGPATSSGKATVQVAGKNFVADMATGSTAAEVAAALAALIGEAVGGTAPNFTVIPVYASAATGTLTIKSKWKSADCNDIAYAVKIEGLTGIVVDSAGGFLAAGAIESDWSDILDILPDDPTFFDYILLATGDTTVLTTGDTSLKYELKAMRRPDGGFKLLKAIIGANGAEADAHTLASAWEEGLVVDETGAFGQAWWGSGQTAPPWTVAAACGGIRFNAESEKVNKNPCVWGGTPVPYLPVPLSKADWPTRTEIRAALNEGVSPLNYDPIRNTTLMVRSVSCKHSTGGLTDYKARPTVVPVVVDYILKDLKSRLESFYSGFFVASDDPATGKPPTDVGSKTVTPYRYKRKVGALLMDYQREGLLENAKALAEAILTQRNPTVTSRLDADAGSQVRRWLEQLGLLLREVGGAA